MEAPESRKSSVPIWIEKTFSGGREHGSVVDGVLVIFFSKGVVGSVQGVLVRIWLAASCSRDVAQRNRDWG